MDSSDFYLNSGISLLQKVSDSFVVRYISREDKSRRLKETSETRDLTRGPRLPSPSWDEKRTHAGSPGSTSTAVRSDCGSS